MRKRSAADVARLGVTVTDLIELEDPTTHNHSKFASAHEFIRLVGGMKKMLLVIREPKDLQIDCRIARGLSRVILIEFTQLQNL